MLGSGGNEMPKFPNPNPLAIHAHKEMITGFMVSMNAFVKKKMIVSFLLFLIEINYALSFARSLR